MSDQHERAASRRVLIVGAGPVGLALATELGWRGVPVTVIEQGDGHVPFPAGEAIFSRTMEHLRRWGCAEEARTESAPPPDYPHRTVFATSATGRVLTDFDYGVTNRSSGVYTQLTPEGPAFLSKFSFVPLLTRTAGELPGVEIRYGTRLETMEQDSEGVLAVVRDVASGATETLAGTYLVACDGGRSGIRRALGIEFEGMFAQGHNFAVHFRAPQLLDLLREKLGGPAVQIHTLASARRPYITVVNGVDEWRLSVYLDEEPDPDDAVAWIREAVGAPIDVEILAAQPWSGHCVVARTYREGRVFLAGDSAHLLWPKGGFGANTGIGDAVDLGWKLAATLQGWGGPALLDSYEQERRPIAVRNVTEASSNWKADAQLVPDPALDRMDAEGDRLRRELGEEIRRSRAKEFRCTGVQLGYRYSGSPICVPDGSPEPPDEPDEYVPSTWPGCRAPHVWLPDGSSTLDHFGRGFTLVVSGSADPTPVVQAARGCGVPLTVLRLADPAAEELYERPLVLIRPDGHVGWRGRQAPADPTAVLDALRGATLPPRDAAAADAGPGVSAGAGPHLF
ncbi:FAD-dependent monooxygenase [Streptomyces scabiei]|uniref:2,4-dichlorophenol 6-monooxygenase n=1 Tax=Streptomyces scabiei TaxID=1930 RepID=A0A100JU99_STRSC|nr:FAD-dependent monooxygenase [Streptomyces scabiei]GAQ65784.1 2,4-dichlorophenol 6-monooxygenase [Streptomyces scabiei]